MLLNQLTSREVSEWAAYFRFLDAPHEAPLPSAPRRAPAVGDDPSLSWQRLLAFADRVNSNRS